ncbi:TPA: hypothetical protein DEO28_04520 [Candidatus Dependentiae bacterium]|nr:MAG: hypothetical protein UR14_C0002G0022 [candidate division TM6 bacterium GW2011_GWE2_31_21]KKP53819.1 MAG: hypothetical protein UR43_C0002G0022 [candidate division TM6 bacterium GW2011_GWF2_33_332]HBS47599.1 hypothetical protein [Candidatus Dependentiae bacterium]HBZ73748.1 hypothetical protein [Candidatus Dependentiae bacterium]
MFKKIVLTLMLGGVVSCNVNAGFLSLLRSLFAESAKSPAEEMNPQMDTPMQNIFEAGVYNYFNLQRIGFPKFYAFETIDNILIFQLKKRISKNNETFKCIEQILEQTIHEITQRRNKESIEEAKETIKNQIKKIMQRRDNLRAHISGEIEDLKQNIEDDNLQPTLKLKLKLECDNLKSQIFETIEKIEDQSFLGELLRRLEAELEALYLDDN